MRLLIIWISIEPGHRGCPIIEPDYLPSRLRPSQRLRANPNNSGMPLVGSDRTRRNRNNESKNPLNIGTTIPKIKRLTRDANGDLIIEYDNQVSILLPIPTDNLHG